MSDLAGSDLVSGEAVLLELRTAKLASRGLAFALDILLQGITLLIAFLIFVPSGTLGFDTALAATISLVLIALVLVGYPAITETLTRGRTAGKAALGLRVVRTDGGPIRLRHALVRALAAFFVDFWALGLFGTVAVIVSLTSRHGQRVGDILAGTFVIRERIPRQATSGPIHMPPPLAGWAATQQVTALPNDLALAIRQYLNRLPQLTHAAATSLGHQLATEVSGRLGTPVPPGVPIPDYLAAVLAERRTREETRLQQPRTPSAEQPTTPEGGPFTPPG